MISRYVMQTSRRKNLSNSENVEKLTIEQKKSKSGDDIENELLIESYENSGFQDDIRITRQKIFFEMMRIIPGISDSKLSTICTFYSELSEDAHMIFVLRCGGIVFSIHLSI